MLKRVITFVVLGCLLLAGGAFAGSQVVRSVRHTVARGQFVHMCKFSQGSCNTGTSTAQCPQGYFATGGGVDGGTQPSVSLNVAYSEPLGGDHAWTVVASNEVNQAAEFRAVAVCVG